jgi:diketogulonate reductase-like aldo/keto reductase
MPDGAVTPKERVRRLADGAEMPLLGLGVWQVPDGPECENAVRWALELGYRHIDTAQAYGNEGSVGRALRDSGVPREDVFITTKFYPGHKDPAAEAGRSLERLGIEQVDLYIIHWPQGGPTWAWPGMEEARERGYARSIGVSNFSLLEACARRDVAVVGYSSLGTGRHLSNSTVTEIAQRLSRTPAQVLLRWCLQRDALVIPKSTHRERIEENAQLFDFELSEQDLAALDGLDHTGGTDEARESKWW